ncbi:MAG: creatininase family protein [Armatimonadota bacterium]|nr:creatininase family protein [Armatimonadota bacterium]
MADRIVRWEMMTPEELDEAIEHLPLAIVPAGSLEWHGPHMSTGSDLLRGNAICTAVAERLGGGVVLPATWVAAPGFCNWRGTISFTPALVRQVALELYRELEKCGFRWIFVNLAHAGAMQRESWEGGANEYSRTGTSVRILVKAGPDGPLDSSIGGGHAGPNEAAELMAADPATVHLDRYDPEDTLLPKYDSAGGAACDPWLYSRGLTPESREAVFRFMAREHYEWDPELAEKVTPEAAQRIFDEVCDRLAEELREWMSEA